MSEVPSVTQAVGGSEEELNGSQLDHSYIRPANDSEDGETHYTVLQPVSQSEAQQPVSCQDENQPAQYSFAPAIPQVGENVEITSSSVQEEGDKLYSQEDIKPNLTELAVPSSGDGRSHLTTLAHQDLRQQIVIKQEIDYSRGKHERDVILALICQLPVENVPYSVDYEDLVKALATPTDKVSVRVMRKTLPCLRIVAYMKNAEFVGKKKIKGLWNSRPYDWPNDVPYKDPNNGEKINGQPIPKANSGDLRQMFKFLKAKFMANIKNEIDQMSEEDKASLPEPPKMALANAAAPVAQRRAPKRSAPAKAAQDPPPRHSSELPVFVQDERFENTYHQMDEDGEEEDEEEAVAEEAPQASYRRMDSQTASSPGQTALRQYVEHFAPQVQEQTNPGTPRQVVCIDMDGQVKSAVQNPLAYVTAPTAHTPSVDHQTPLVVKLPEPATIQPTSPETEMLPEPEVRSPTEVSEEKEVAKPTIVAETLHLTSMPVQRQDSAASVKKMLVQPTDEPTPLVVAPQQPTTMEMGAYFNSAIGAQMFSAAQNPAASLYSNPSMFSIMQAQQPNPMGAAIVRDLFQRQKEKIMYLQNITLGDEEISACLSRMFSQMIQPLFSRALVDTRHASAFIAAAHKCESLMDKAMTDGKKLSRKSFLDECNVLTEEYGSAKPKEQQNLTVFNTTMPEHPPVQSDTLRKLQDVAPACLMPPKSPGTFLGEKFNSMNIQSPSGTTDINKALEGDLSALGIKQKKNGPLNNMFELRTPVAPPPSEPEKKEKKDLNDMKALEELDIECQMLAAVLTQSNMETEESEKKSESDAFTATLLKIMQGHENPMMTQNDPFMPSTTDEVKQDTEAPGLSLEVGNEQDILNDVMGMMKDYCAPRPKQDKQPLQPQQQEQGALYSNSPMFAFQASPADAPAINNAVHTLGGPGHVQVGTGKPVAAGGASYARVPMKNFNAGKARPSASRSHGKMPYQQPAKRAPQQIVWQNPNNPVRSAVGLQPSGLEVITTPTDPSPIVIPSTVLMAEVMDQDQDDGPPQFTYTPNRLPPEKRSEITGAALIWM